MPFGLPWPVVGPLLTGFGLSAVLVPLCRIVAMRVGVVAHPSHDRWHRTTIPLLGGVAIVLATLTGALAGGIARPLAVPLAASALIFIVGLVDDVLTLKPATKLIAQITMAALLVYFGYSLSWVESRLLNSVLTIVWVVGLTNAFNLLDNMDGLCGGIAMVVAAMLVVSLVTGPTRDEAGAQVALSALLLGSTVGFLLYNFPPASIFMGDSGSLFLGFTLASLTLSPEGIRASRTDVISVIAGPVFVLMIPIFDTTLVTASRLFAGRSPAMGGRDHSSHRLVAIGLSERSAVLVLWGLAAVGGVLGIALRASGSWSSLAGAAFLLAMSLFAVFLARVRVYDDHHAPAGVVTPLFGDVMYKRRVAEVVVDFIATGVAFYAAYRIRFWGANAYLDNVEGFYQALPVVLAAQLIAFFVVGIYRGTWHYSGPGDALAFVKGVALGTIAAQFVLLYVYNTQASRGAFLVYVVIACVLVVGSRAAALTLGRIAKGDSRAVRRVVIYGAGGHAGVAVEELHAHREWPVRVLGFIDDDQRLMRSRVEGYAVLGGYAALAEMIASRAVDIVILNRADLGHDRRVELEAACEAADVSLLRLHVGIEEIVPGEGASPAASLRAQLRRARR